MNQLGLVMAGDGPTFAADGLLMTMKERDDYWDEDGAMSAFEVVMLAPTGSAYESDDEPTLRRVFGR